jgi:hypothetical protein
LCFCLRFPLGWPFVFAFDVSENGGHFFSIL